MWSGWHNLHRILSHFPRHVRRAVRGSRELGEVFDVFPQDSVMRGHNSGQNIEQA